MDAPWKKAVSRQTSDALVTQLPSSSLVGENGREPLSIDDIRKDAEKVRPYDSMYDMYYDEFEDAEVAQW